VFTGATGIPAFQMRRAGEIANGNKEHKHKARNQDYN
jgi:hypothetical protein